ncbi:MAG: DnaJ C-terminal domain-containing protein [bacterium]|nr:DnaJ C-terminal domain-containing protein [bacterium]
MKKDYYQILGVNKDASSEQLKDAYRKLAHKHHPDKSGGDEKKFKEMNEAYQILSNKEKRAQYDQFGDSFSNMGQGGGYSHSQGNPFAGFDFGGFSQGNSMGGDFGDLGDIFETFFGGGSGRGRSSASRKRRGADLETLQEISLEDAFMGANKELTFHVSVKCKTCSGLGHMEKEGSEKCSTCDGRGEVKEIKKTFFGQFAQVRACPKCEGAGQIPKKACKECSGSGKIKERKTIGFFIAPGINDGQIIKIAGAGEAGEKGAESGDLYVRIKILPHPVFQRKENGLYIKREVGLTDLLLNKKIEIPVISGGKINIEIPEGFYIQEKLIVPNEGMPKFEGRGRGNLYVEFKTKTPKKLSSKAKKFLEDLEKEL